MMREYIQLNEASNWGNKRVKVQEIELKQYVSTENLIADKGGKVLASNLPDAITIPAFEKNDILISNIRPYFKKIYFADEFGGCSNDVLVVKAKKEYNPEFLYYVLSDNNFFNYATVTSKGTKMPRGSKHAIMKYLVPNISKAEQEKIANILSTYDKLIENNNRRIKILEQAAEELYKEWFVRMRFPGHENAKFVNGIPEGWDLLPIGDLISYDIGGGWGEEKANENHTTPAYVIRGTDIPKAKIGIPNREVLRYHKESNLKARILKGNDIVFEVSGGSAGQPLGRVLIIKDVLLNSFDEKVMCASFCKMIRPIIGYSNFLYAILNYCWSKDILNPFQVQSTGITNFKYLSFKKHFIIAIPNRELLQQFDKESELILNTIFGLGAKNQNLIKQRDLLLPRLMSGKMEV